MTSSQQQNYSKIKNGFQGDKTYQFNKVFVKKSA